MSELHRILWLVCRKLPSDFQPYGSRDRDRDESGADCSCGCIHFQPLNGEAGMDWGVCANAKSPRAGLLTFEHQGCPEFMASGAELPADGKSAGQEGEAMAAEMTPLRKLKIVEYELTDAFGQTETFDGEEIRAYLDAEEGGILQLFSEWEDFEELSERVDSDPDRYHRINALDSRASFRIMEEFAESLPESSWKFRLMDALSRAKPFRRFKDEAHSDLRLRDQWLAFQREALKEHARDWLKSLGIEPQFVSAAETD